ncbi:MAG: hypothetical protein R3B84_11415 [Zavarzinella sp.]
MSSKSKNVDITNLTIDSPSSGDPIISSFTVYGTGDNGDFVWLYVYDNQDNLRFSSQNGTLISNEAWSINVSIGNCTNSPHSLRAYVSDAEDSEPNPAEDTYIQINNLTIACVGAEPPITITIL